MASSSEVVPQLSRSEVKNVLNEVILALSEENNCRKLMAARLGSDRMDSDCPQLRPQISAVRHMQSVFPIMTQILMDVISNYGFSKTGEGVVQFSLAVKHMETTDEEIKQLNDELKNHFIPNLKACLATNSAID